jgi:G-protein coupled receptor 98
VNITSVRLASESDREGSVTNSPRLLAGGGIVTIQIQENDNSRGVIDVAFTTASVAEEPNAAVSLEIVRTRGAFGTVAANYIVRPGTASLDDVSRATASGTVQLIGGQQRAMFMIDIVNDAIPELDEVFTVELESATDGAQIGNQNVITVTILANDDINGVFSFSNTSLLVSSFGRPCVNSKLFELIT